MFKIIDNVIGEKYSKYIFESFADIRWMFLPDVTYGESATGINKPGFIFNYYVEGQSTQQEFNLIKPMLLESFDKFNLNYSLDSIYRCRARLTLDRPELKEENRTDAPHIDYKFPHLVLLYYVNNTDGDTIFYEGSKIVNKVSPKRGRCILFDGSIVHAATTPTLSPRVVINTNIKMN